MGAVNVRVQAGAGLHLQYFRIFVVNPDPGKGHIEVLNQGLRALLEDYSKISFPCECIANIGANRGLPRALYAIPLLLSAR